MTKNDDFPGAQAGPQQQPESAPPNIVASNARAEWALLAETDPETILKGLMLECRELVRGTANMICDPYNDDMHEAAMNYLTQGSNLCARLAESIVKLRKAEALDEQRQRIVVEHIDRGFVRLYPREPRVTPAPAGEGGAEPAKNE